MIVVMNKAGECFARRFQALTYPINCCHIGRPFVHYRLSLQCNEIVVLGQERQ